MGFEEPRLREILQLQLFGRDPRKGGPGRKADQFRLGDLDAAPPGEGADAAEGRGDGRLAAVCQIHRDLHEPAAPQGDAEGADGGQAAAGFPDLPGDVARKGQVLRREIDVEGDQRNPRADDHGAQARVEVAGPRVGFPVRVAEALGKLLVSAPPDFRKLSAPGIESRLAVKVHGHREPLPGLPSEAVRRGDRIFHFSVGEGHEGDDVRSTDARMDALMGSQVDPRKGRLQGGKRRANDAVRFSEEGEDAPVVIAVAVHIRKAHALHPFDRRRDGAHRAGIPSFAEIGNAFDDLHDTHT
ncbi:MAG: hypothetical protein A4E73_01259 [Syntrophaceae bacterium PtaU1.Bin231]|nr:MAG: hypothetical protein A4E73_01259 [Syntrophaceae bacterium PtaU1.Bin231]